MKLEDFLSEYREIGISCQSYLIQGGVIRHVQRNDFQLPVILEAEVQCGRSYRILYFREDENGHFDNEIEQISLFEK